MICDSRPMQRLWLLFLICLTACGQPGLSFRGIDPVRVEVGSDVFDIRVRGLRAEAIRLNTRAARNLGDIGFQAVLAIEKVTECQVARLAGDQAVAVATLDCGSGAPARPPFPPVLDCEAIDLGQGTFDLACFP
ncbi:MAG: hypothetical protein AAF922_08735 [Pseudomonadota bacterium]